jgi:hypothetical protein
VASSEGDPEAAKKTLDALQPWPSHGEGKHIAGAAVFRWERHVVQSPDEELGTLVIVSAEKGTSL